MSVFRMTHATVPFPAPLYNAALVNTGPHEASTEHEH